jgi:UDP-3-O-[3-hydroxymyristoyl] N-acetylglucosamine deacetylase
VNRKTIREGVKVEGIGLHSGGRTKVFLHPCEGGHGIVFSVHNEQGSALIPALTPFVAETRRRVVLAKDGVSVQTVEHLLAACFGMGITDLMVEVQGAELPIGDGSAQLWVDAFKEAGIVCLNEPAPLFSPTETVTVQDGNALITVAPSDRFTATVTFVTDHLLVGVQTATFDEETDDFVTAIAPARTFGFWEEVEALLTQGLAKGGSLENALVVFPDRYSSPLRFPDELARHKLLDLMGDLMLLGRRLTAKVTAKASGHSLHHRLCQTLWHQVAQEAKA